MKSDYILIVLGLAAAYLATQKKSAGSGTNSATGATEIKTQGQTNGWRYFTDGTAIGPDGNYYFQGNLIYDPQADYRTSF